METAEKYTHRALLIEAYRKHVLVEGKPPVSVYKFCLQTGLNETDFYACFGSFEAVEMAIWSGYLEATRARLAEDETFSSFSTREKVLAFYFALAEELKSDRSFVLLQLKEWKPALAAPRFLKTFRTAFLIWFSDILREGKQTGEIANRPVIDTRYSDIFWMHFLFLLGFWKNDSSTDFEQTDVAIEKSVNLAFDLIGRGVLDGALDFGKFLFQQARQ